MRTVAPARVAALHDLSCFGRCALTVIIPTLSAMGCQVIPVPTALLSTHTGGFDGLYFRDLTGDMEKISSHLGEVGVTFRAIYTGFLGSAAQIRTVEAFLDAFGNRPDETGAAPLLFVDPVMGDDGVLYSTYTDELVAGVRELSRRAQVLTPNLTEACLLAGVPYRETGALSRAEALAFAGELLENLEKSLGVPRIVITGIPLCGGELLNLGRDADGSRFSVVRPLAAPSYPGTGDIFASVVLGALLRGDSFSSACGQAADFTGLLITESSSIERPVREGVALEPYLCRLCRAEN